MIKIFGKVRYHWQPESSLAIIYWSLSFTPLFLALALILEKTVPSLLIVALLVVFLILLVAGLQRYFEIKEDYLLVAAANPWARRRILLKDIEKLQVNYLSITFIIKNEPQGYRYYMRKWPKKYFVNTLTRHPEFAGEVELVDHLIQLDYFEAYYAKKAKSF